MIVAPFRKWNSSFNNFRKNVQFVTDWVNSSLNTLQALYNIFPIIPPHKYSLERSLHATNSLQLCKTINISCTAFYHKSGNYTTTHDMQKFTPYLEQGPTDTKTVLFPTVYVTFNHVPIVMF